MDSKMEQRELISALADGQLEGDAFARAVEAATAGADGRQAWHAYHLVGDVLRTGQAGVSRSPEAFLAKLSRQLEQEQPLRPAADAPLAPVAVPAVRVAANDASFRWKMVAGLASVAAVAAVAWTVVGGAGLQQVPQPQLAGATVPPQPQLATGAEQAGATVAVGERGVMIRDARLDEILAAHRQFGGASALQMPAGFLRNATFEGASR